MLQSIKSYPYLYLALLGTAALCVFAWVKALRASRRRQAEKQALIARLEYAKQLRADFSSLSRALLLQTPAMRLIEGLCSHLQAEQDKASDLHAAFAALSEPQRLVYALGYVLSDGREGLSTFFRRNGQPLTGAALQAMRLCGDEAYGIFAHEYDAFDETNETVSLAQSDLDWHDTQWCALLETQRDEAFSGVKDYILLNYGAF